MRVSDKAIVLQSVKYGDRKYILKLFTLGHGIISVSAVTGSAPSAKIKPALIRSMMPVEFNAVMKQNREIHQLTEISAVFVPDRIHTDVVRIGILQFINEVLLRCLKEQVSNSELYVFLESSLRFLNEDNIPLAVFPVYFLKELASYLGIAPHNNHSAADRYFDCREGRFTSVSLSFPLGLDEKESLLLRRALEDDLFRKEFNREERGRLLEILIAYYRLHVPGFQEPKSIAVFREVMNA